MVKEQQLSEIDRIADQILALENQMVQELEGDAAKLVYVNHELIRELEKQVQQPAKKVVRQAILQIVAACPLPHHKTRELQRHLSQLGQVQELLNYASLEDFVKVSPNTCRIIDARINLADFQKDLLAKLES